MGKLKNNIKRIAIIGGGWSGLYALKYSLEEGFEATIFEKKSQIGGVWTYQEHECGGVWKSAHATSSKTFLHASDFPMPEETSLFPHHSKIYQYLCDYVEHFSLGPHIKFNHEIQNIEQRGQTWRLSIFDHNKNRSLQQTFDAVLLCTGQTSTPSTPTDPMYQNFEGKTMHSASYKYPKQEFRGKSVLVIGGGESGSDIANELTDVAGHVYLSVRSGLWFFTRHNGVFLPTDTRFSKRNRWLVSDYGNNIFVRLSEILTNVNYGVGGHGIEAWKPNYSVLGGIINKSVRVLEKIPLGLVTPKRAVVSVQSNTVMFEGDSEPTPIDVIIYATGYKQELPFNVVKSSDELYKHLFYVENPTFAVLGRIRPIFGSIVGLAELQARWVTAVLAGKATLPNKNKMRETIVADRLKQKKNFPDQYEKRPHLVSHFSYADFIMKELGAYPRLIRLFFTNFKKWKLLILAPWTPFEVFLNNPQKEPNALERIQQVYAERRRVKGPSLFKLLTSIVFVSTIVVIMAMILSSYSLWLLLS
ncbi:MAG: FAD-dependent oxidoreductase [Chloroflexota bacterium]